MLFKAGALAALAAGVVAQTPLATVTPCPQCPSNIAPAPITVTSQFQTVSTAIGNVTTSCRRRTCSTSVAYSTYEYFSTVIPCADGSCTVTKTDEPVTISRDVTTSTFFATAAVATPFSNYTNSTLQRRAQPIYEILETDYSALFNELGPLAIPGYAGSGLCTDCEDQQRVNVTECVTWSNSTVGTVCLAYAQVWVTAEVPPVTVTQTQTVSSQVAASSNGVYTVTVTATVPAQTVTHSDSTVTLAPSTTQVPITTQVTNAPTTAQINTIIVITVTRTVYGTSTPAGSVPTTFTSSPAQSTAGAPTSAPTSAATQGSQAPSSAQSGAGGSVVAPTQGSQAPSSAQSAPAGSTATATDGTHTSSSAVEVPTESATSAPLTTPAPVSASSLSPSAVESVVYITSVVYTTSVVYSTSVLTITDTVSNTVTTTTTSVAVSTTVVPVTVIQTSTVEVTATDAGTTTAPTTGAAATDVSTTASATTAAPTAGATTFHVTIQTSARKYHKRAVSYLAFSGDDGILVSTVQEAAEFFIDDLGRLLSGTQYVGVSTANGYYAFEKFDSPPSISQTWSYSGGTISFVNPSFSLTGGIASFCTTSDGSVIITLGSSPSNCAPVSLTAVSTTDGTVLGLDNSSSSSSSTSATASATSQPAASSSVPTSSPATTTEPATATTTTPTETDDEPTETATPTADPSADLDDEAPQPTVVSRVKRSLRGPAVVRRAYNRAQQE